MNGRLAILGASGCAASDGVVTPDWSFDFMAALLAPVVPWECTWIVCSLILETYNTSGGGCLVRKPCNVHGSRRREIAFCTTGSPTVAERSRNRRTSSVMVSF